MTERAKILIIDDEEILHKSIKRALKHAGYHFIHAFNGEEGLYYYQEHQPSLVLLDSTMPIMNGLQFLRKLHQKYDVICPIIAFGGYTTEEDKDSYFDLGINSFLEKPFAIKKLTSQVSLALTVNNAD